MTRKYWLVGVALLVVGAAWAWSQEPAPQPPPGSQPPPPRGEGPPPSLPPFEPGGPGGRGGFGFPGPGAERKLVAQFDKDGDGRLNAAERKAAREAAPAQAGWRGGRGAPPPGARGGPGGPGDFGFPRGPGGPGGSEPAKPGQKIAPSDVAPLVSTDLYDASVLRTLFLDFENADWEAEMAAFNNSDVEVPATLTVDGKTYPQVGVHFRGMSSFMGVPAGSKRSLNVSLDFVDTKQRLYGYKTLNLLNAHEDASFLSSVLYSHISRKHIPAPKANLVRVVINGENWGVYVNVQQFDKIFLTENFNSDKGTRWKVQGSPGGNAGLQYAGDSVEAYKRRYTIKSGDKAEAWQALIKLCKTLSETPADKLEAALAPMLDIDGALWFLALDNALINSDGYWIRASDYCIYLDEKGVFHLVAHDMNEAFRPAMGPGMGGPGGPGGRGRGMRGGPEGPGGPPPREFGPGGPPPGDGPQRFPFPPPGEFGPGDGPGRGPVGRGGPEGRGLPPGSPRLTLDPLVGLDDPSKPLRSKLLAVPSLKARYLKYVKQIAEQDLDWKQLGPVVASYEKLIAKEIEADTKKLSSYAAFQAAVAQDPTATAARSGRVPPLAVFAKERREFLLKYQEPVKP